MLLIINVKFPLQTFSVQIYLYSTSHSFNFESPKIHFVKSFLSLYLKLSTDPLEPSCSPLGVHDPTLKPLV